MSFSKKVYFTWATHTKLIHNFWHVQMGFWPWLRNAGKVLLLKMCLKCSYHSLVAKIPWWLLMCLKWKPLLHLFIINQRLYILQQSKQIHSFAPKQYYTYRWSAFHFERSIITFIYTTQFKIVPNGWSFFLTHHRLWNLAHCFGLTVLLFCVILY